MKTKHIDDLPAEAIGCIKMLQKVFEGTDFSNKVPSVFLDEYNNATEILCSQRT